MVVQDVFNGGNKVQQQRMQPVRRSPGPRWRAAVALLARREPAPRAPGLVHHVAVQVAVLARVRAFPDAQVVSEAHGAVCALQLRQVPAQSRRNVLRPRASSQRELPPGRWEQTETGPAPRLVGGRSRQPEGGARRPAFACARSRRRGPARGSDARSSA
eukprot:3596500-Rhodomonas_salina.2